MKNEVNVGSLTPQQRLDLARGTEAEPVGERDVAQWPTTPGLSARPSDDELWDQTLTERDSYHEAADKLTAAIAKHFGQDFGEHSSMNEPWSNALEFMSEQAGALEANAAPVGEREAFEAYCGSIGYTLKVDDSGRYLGRYGAELWAGWKAHAAYQRAQQPQSAEPLAWLPKWAHDRLTGQLGAVSDPVLWGISATLYVEQTDNTVPVYTTPQPSAGVVMPERKECDDGYPSDDWLIASAWNACLDEFARLNGKETV